ncbi:hypothetical protein FMUND_12872 [Fusarium mundagurra]|uniref:Uncharacterized protein n=1 Tax=Fusarium mundagurra TaxID=1567541 RepID=A0A8H6D550_9HYPO|nr:hypothetical protein FMUND_12872 [Fusarium mundagurra]
MARNAPEDLELGDRPPARPESARPESPKLIGPPVAMTFSNWDETYFNQFRLNPHELSYLAVHDFRYLQMKNIYYCEMNLLNKYPSGTPLNEGNIVELRRLLAEYCQALKDYEFMLRLPKPSERKVRVQRQCLEHVGSGRKLDRNDHRVIRGPNVGFLGRIFSQDLSDAAPGKTIKLKGKFDILFRDLSGMDIIRRICVGTLAGAPFLLVPMIIL